MFNELQFILNVKQHKLLYVQSTNHYKPLLHNLWQTLANDFELDGANKAQRMWQQIVQKYLRYLRCSSGGSEEFPYAAEMQFMQPYLMWSQNDDSSHSDLELDEADLQRILNSDDEYETCVADNSSLPIQTDNVKTVEIKQEEVTEMTATNVTASASNNINSTADALNNVSSLELIFLGYAKVLQKMPKALQLQTKRKIADIMDDAEMQLLEQ